MRHIVVKGARTHNLRNVDVQIPRDQYVVVTGLSGSGKSSLAFDTIFAEGQRRYVESLSAYARQFLDQMDKPDVDLIDGLQPAIAIEQRSASRNPRSSVGTVTEIYDYLRLLWARIGVPHCWTCGKPIAAHTLDQMIDRVLKLPEGTKFSVLAPVVRGEKGDFKDLFPRLMKDGYVRAQIDGELLELDDTISLDARKKHQIDVYIDRLVQKDGIRQRLADSIEIALRLSDGLVRVTPLEGDDLFFSERATCSDCGTRYPEITPRMFSWNSPLGACTTCDGMGVHRRFDPDLIVQDPELSLREGAILPWERRNAAHFQQLLDTLAVRFEFDLNAPWKSLPPKIKTLLLHGSGKEIVEFKVERNGRKHTFKQPFEGVLHNLEQRFAEYGKGERGSGDGGEDLQTALEEMQQYMAQTPCADCEGTRLRIESRHIRIGGQDISGVTRMTTRAALHFFKTVDLPRRDRLIADRILREVTQRLSFLVEVGVDYLSLDRSAATLSGGEAQRIRLATQIGSGLSGVLYVLDEPSIGLHPRDNERLLQTLLRLRDLGNTVLVVEHDEALIRAADYVIDMGPYAGELGGKVVAAGTPTEIIENTNSLTGAYLSGEKRITPGKRRTPGKRKLVLRGASANNLRNVTLQIPLGTLTCITGVSGSGKSSLVVDTLLPALRNLLAGGKAPTNPFESLEGLQHLDRVIDIDQSPIGRTPRSNPATYAGLFTFIRDIFAELPEAKTRGFKSGRFSFNTKGGRCERCQGDGIIRIEMHFLPDVYVQCEVCGGKRYDRETLEIRYRGASIADVLNMTITEAMALLQNVPRLRQRLEVLREVGLGYIRLGQPANTLSGGEAQRIKLGRELGKRDTGRTIYILDEPTTGLHFADIEQLLAVLNRLVDSGNTVIVIEHNLDVIKCADWVIDLGPEGGPDGGKIVAEGTPEDVARATASHTGRFIKSVL